MADGRVDSPHHATRGMFGPRELTRVMIRRGDPGGHHRRYRPALAPSGDSPNLSGQVCDIWQVRYSEAQSSHVAQIPLTYPPVAHRCVAQSCQLDGLAAETRGAFESVQSTTDPRWRHPELGSSFSRYKAITQS